MSRFASTHPAVAAVYFVSVLAMTMFTVHPALSAMALIGAFLYSTVTEGLCLKNVLIWLGLFALIAVTNPLFSHNGATPLFFLNGNPVTLEAILYGASLAVMLIAVMRWFTVLNAVMTSDKLLYLFGGVSPKIALLISSALRFIPLLKAQAEKIRQSQKAMGLWTSDTWTDKLRGTVRVYSALITWALENAIDTGSSMKARGYGLQGRSRYSLFRFRRSDALLLALITVLDAAVISAIAAGQLGFAFYPSIAFAPANQYNIPAMAAFAVLCFLPFILEVKEALLWKYYRSRI